MITRSSLTLVSLLTEFTEVAGADLTVAHGHLVISTKVALWWCSTSGSGHVLKVLEVLNVHIPRESLYTCHGEITLVQTDWTVD